MSNTNDNTAVLLRNRSVRINGSPVWTAENELVLIVATAKGEIEIEFRNGVRGFTDLSSLSFNPVPEGGWERTKRCYKLGRSVQTVAAGLTNTNHFVPPIVRDLREAARAYHCHEISQEELGATNLVLWQFAEARGIIEEVKEGLRVAQAEEAAYTEFCRAEEARLEYR